MNPPDNEISRRTLLGGALTGGVAAAVAADTAAGVRDDVEDLTPQAIMSVMPDASDMLRVSAITTVGSPWLPDGTHLRVNVSPRIGFPLHPFAAFRCNEIATPPPNMVWLNRNAQWVGTSFPDLAAYGGTVYCVLYGQGAGTDMARFCYVQVSMVPGSSVRVEVLGSTAELPDGRVAVLASRSTAPYAFAGTDITLLRLTGIGRVQSVLAIDANFARPRSSDPDLVFGLPIGAGRWYLPDPAGGDPVAAARSRVARGAPSQMGPPDRPDGSVVAVSAADEVNRVNAIAALPSGIDYWTNRCFTAPAKAPIDVTVSLSAGPGQLTSGSIAATSALLTMSVDPSIARYLGLATRVDVPATDLSPYLWLVAGLWLLPLNRPHPNGTLRSILQAPPFADGFLGPLYQRFPDLRALAERRVAELRAAAPADGWELVPLAAIAVSVRGGPPDPPAPPSASIVTPGTWRTKAGSPLWTQPIRIQGPAPAGMLGFARLSPDRPVSLHRTVQVSPTVTRARALIPHWDSNQDNHGTLTDPAVPGAASATWGLWQADEFGRWSRQATIGAAPPPVAPPSPPTLDVGLDPAVPTQTTDPRSPGTLLIKIGVPGRTLDDGREVTAPGGSPVTTALLTVDGQLRSAIPVPAGASSVTTTVAVRPFAVGEAADIPVSARLADAAARTSKATETSRRVHDPRGYPPLLVAPSLLFTSDRDPTGNSELALEWSSAAWGYRVYLGDERRLGGSVTGARHERAAAICARAGELTDRRMFTMLTHDPLRADANGNVRFTKTLPGSLRAVQFVRVVPVTSAGVEPAFETCGLVPVAVPVPDRAPPPVVRVAPRPDGRVSVTITATGLRTDLLAGRDGAPQARLRRTLGSTVIDPEFVPIVATGIPLTRSGNGSWSATVIDGPATGLFPFVRYTWLAEVRYPPEPHLPTGAVPEDSPVRPVAVDEPGPKLSGWSDTSGPAITMITPLPTPPTSVNVSWTSNVISVAGLPTAHTRAIARYRIVVHRLSATAPSTRIGPTLVTGPAMAIQDNPAQPPAAYAVVLLDPLNRPTTPTIITR